MMHATIGTVLVGILVGSANAEPSSCKEYLSNKAKEIYTFTVEQDFRINPLSKTVWDMKDTNDNTVAQFVDYTDLHPQDYKILLPSLKGQFEDSGYSIDRNLIPLTNGFLYTDFIAEWDHNLDGKVEFLLPYHRAKVKIGEAYVTSKENSWSRFAALEFKLTFREAENDHGLPKGLEAAVVRYNWRVLTNKYKICIGTAAPLSDKELELYGRIFSATGVAFDYTLRRELDR